MATRFDKAELIDLTLIILILSVFFSFRFPGKATISNWAPYFISILILVAFSIFIHELVHHLAANKHMVLARSKIWWFGVFFGFFLLLVSNGRFIFAAIWTITLTPIYLMRPGKAYSKWHAGPYERAKIAAAGPLANLAIAIFAKLFINDFGFAQPLMDINLWMAVLNLFPFFTPLIAPLFGAAKKTVTTPYAEGEYVFFGSRPLWTFVFSFALTTSISLHFLPIFTSMLISAITAMLAWLAWHFYIEAYPKA